MFMSEFLNDVKLSPMTTLLALAITALGMVSSFLVVLLYVTDSGIEKHHVNYEQTYRIETQFNLPSGDSVKSAQVPLPLLSVLENENDIKETSFALRLFMNLHAKGQTHTQVDIFAVSPNFFNVITPYKGKIPNLTQNEIIITPEFNDQYLQLDNPKGHIITLGDKGQYVIKEVVEFVNTNRLNVQAVIAFSPYLIEDYHDKRHDWYDMHAYAYITMKPSGKPSNDRLNALVTQYAPQLPGAPFSPEEFIQLSARPITDVHYDHELPDEMSKVISKAYIYTLYAAGIFISLVTIMNFFNLNNVINSHKKSSFQIKKSIGASHIQLLVESLTIATVQLILVFVLAIIFLAALMYFSVGFKELILMTEISQIYSSFITVLAFIYLAVLLSHLIYLSTVVFPNHTSHSNTYNEQSLSRNLHQSLLCLQIIVASVIIFLWAGIMTQNDFMQHHHFGYEKINVITFPLSEQLKQPASLNNLQDEMKNSTGGGTLSLSSWLPFDHSKHSISIFHHNQQEKDKLASVNIIQANKNFIETWGLKTIAGRENLIVASDDDDVGHAIVTKSFMATMGFSSFDKILNTDFYINHHGMDKKVRILRVINDFYLSEPNEDFAPLLILIENEVQKYGALKVNQITDMTKVKNLLERHHVAPEKIKTVEHLHEDHFSNGQLINKTVNTVTFIATLLITISTIIIGISETRRIKKTLMIMDAIGGSIYTHILYFIRQNILPIAIATVIAIPIGFLLLDLWLNQYDMINNLSYIYAMAALLILVMSLIFVMSITLIINQHSIIIGNKK
ncbi:Membrane protein [Yersinia massiliensis]|uniref:darobactin export ABC transporter permease subunit n=1 Tax=Yersinia massiliensis TaxID=419257 RepID=UPI0005E28E65|nr:darobactin export ABC transporter permease subunit [Yersinia massiliensis]CNH84077.1 Membrane protein [Yersinia massiliensis]